MEVTVTEQKIDRLKPKMKTLEKLELLNVVPNKTVASAKLDGEFTLLVFNRKSGSYTLNKWGKIRTDFPALNQFNEAMNKTSMEEAQFLCELHARDEQGKPLKLPEFIHAIKGKDRDLSKIHIGIWDYITKNPAVYDYQWKMGDVSKWIEGCSHVKVVPFIMAKTLQEVKDFENVYVEGKGYEGLVIRQPTCIYKIKPTLEVDAVIIGLNKKTSYGKKLDLFERGQVTSIKLALMVENGDFIELSDCASGITAQLRTVLWKLNEYKVSEDDKTVYIKPVAICTIQFTDTFIKRKRVLHFTDKYREVARPVFVSLRHPRLTRFRPDKSVCFQDLRTTQIPENKLPPTEDETPDKPTISKEEGEGYVRTQQGRETPEADLSKLEIPRVVKPSILKDSYKNFDDLLHKLYAEKWMINSNLMGATLEEAVERQAKIFPCVEFQPVQLESGLWVAFHRTTAEEYLKAQKPQTPKEPDPEENPYQDHVSGVTIQEGTSCYNGTLEDTPEEGEDIADKIDRKVASLHTKEWDEEYARRKKFKYIIEIKPPSWKDHLFSVHYSKNYGCLRGGATEFKTKADLIAYFQKMFKEWEEWDSIVERKSDKVTPKNLYFKSFTPDITKMELFGTSTLSAFPCLSTGSNSFAVITRTHRARV